MVETKERAHYFMVEEPRAKTSKGVCKRCGEERTFDNVHFIEQRYKSTKAPKNPQVW